MSDAIIRSVITSYFFVGVVVGLIAGLLLAAILSVSLRLLAWRRFKKPDKST